MVDKKVVVTGHGVDIDQFSPQEAIKDIDLLTVGRLSPSKNLESLLVMLKELQTDSLGLTDLINWVGSVPNEKLPDYLSRTKVFIHASKTGSLDKTLLEPLLVGVPVVTSATGAKSLPLGDWRVNSVEEMAQVVGELLKTMPTDKIEELREFVISNHSLQNLIPRICSFYHKK